MIICPLWGCFPETIVTVEDIKVVDGHHFIAANFDGQLLHDGAAQILNHSRVAIHAVQSDREGQPRGPGDNHIVFAKVGEPDKQPLVLVDAARIVGDDHRLWHSFDTQRLAEGAVRIKLAHKFARSHCRLKLCDNLQMSCPHMADYDFENPTFDPRRAWKRR